ncbi:MAG: WD40 repeat domain-containing protein [Saprospiraceae bacterium]|nr:WD40 repeat domain-containing protein [Saprospiraceae bacterium]
MITKHAIIISVYLWGSLALIIPQRLAAQQENPCYQHYFEKGVEAFDRGDFNRAINFYEAARACLKEEPSVEIDALIKTARQSLNDALSEAKINAKVTLITAEALKAQPYDATLALNLAHEACLLSKNDNKLAVEVRRTILEDPENHYYSKTLQPGAPINSMAVSPDQKWLVVGLGSHEIKKIAVDSIGKSKNWILIGFHKPKINNYRNINSITYSPNGKSVLTTANDSTAFEWTAEECLPSLAIGRYDNFVADAAYSPSGDTLVTSSGYDLIFWKFDANKTLLQIPPTQKFKDYINQIAYAPNGRFVVGAGGDHQIYLLDFDKSKPEILPGHNSPVLSIAISNDSRYLCTGDMDGEAILWRADNGIPQISARLKGHQKTVSCIAFDPGNEYVLTGSDDGTVRLWDVEGRLVKVLKGHQYPVTAIAFIHGGKTIVTAGLDGNIRLWSFDTETLSQTYAHTQEINDVCFSPDGSLVLTGSADQTARLWRCDDGRLLHSFRYNKDVSSVIFHPNGKWIGIGIADGNISLRDTGGLLLQTIFAKASAVRSIDFAHNSDKLLSAHNNWTTLLWDKWQEGIKTELAHHSGPVIDAQFSYDDKYIISIGDDGVLAAYNTVKRDTISFVSKGRLTCLAHSPNQHLAAAIFNEDTILLWNYIKKWWTKWPIKSNDINTAIAFSPDGNRIATGDAWGLISIWSLQGDSLAAFKAQSYSSEIKRIHFSPNGEQLLIAGSERFALLLNAADGSLLRVFGAHSGNINAMAVSPDGTLIATGGDDGKIILWNNKRRITGVYSVSDNPVHHLALAPDKMTIAATTNYGGKLVILNLEDPARPAIFDTETSAKLVAFSPDGRLIAGVPYDNVILLFNDKGEIIKRLELPIFDEIVSIYFSGDNHTLNVGTGDNLYSVNLDNEYFTAPFNLENSLYFGILDFTPSPANDKVACRTENWDSASRNYIPQVLLKDTVGKEKILKLPNYNSKSLAFDSSGKYLLCTNNSYPNAQSVLFDADLGGNSTAELERFSFKSYEHVMGTAFLGNSDTVVVCGQYSGPVFFRSMIKTLQKGSESFIQPLSLTQQEEFLQNADRVDCFSTRQIDRMQECAEYYYGHDRDSSILLYEKIVELSPTPQNKLNLGLAYFDKPEEIEDPVGRIAIQKKVVVMFSEVAAEQPCSYYHQFDLHIAYSNLAWYQILAGRFHDALQSAETAVSMPNVEDKGIVYTNLALSLLCLGGDENVERAKSIYLEWKDKEWRDDTNFSYFRDAFLTDLEDSHIQDLAKKDPALKARIEEVKTTVLAQTND